MMTPGNLADPPVVLIRGAGEQASGVGWALHRAGFRVVMTEIAQPLMVRWPVCFGTAILEGSWEVEGIRGMHIESPQDCPRVWQQGGIPILVDPDLKHLPQIRPDILIDAIMAKRNLGTTIASAPLTIGMGPGFCAGKDVHRVLETNRGHNLGRLINSGYAEPNTGIPEAVLGYTKERVLYAPGAGIFEAKCRIGEEVRVGDILGLIQQGEQITPVQGNLGGVVRGLLRSGTVIIMNENNDARIKVGDIDPRFKEEYCWTVSDKARTLGTSVLLGIIEWMNGGR
ncbi:selenium-dependent molybdenum cofactor biosynthesis protein YqeB [Desulfitobacterium sp. THU1]|uniref:selenium-dependent molybdenum cofactor biosynthesis protein YqeB n=1 Tax=Desulfitobacterium sp. THU1 TaxID=3138072 RepID=UPI00311D870E